MFLFYKYWLFCSYHTQTWEKTRCKLQLRRKILILIFFPAVVFSPQKCYKAAVLGDAPTYPSTVQSMSFKKLDSKWSAANNERSHPEFILNSAPLMFCLLIKKNKILWEKTQKWAHISIQSELKSLRLQHSSGGPPLDNGRSRQVPEQTTLKKHLSRLKPLLWNTAVNICLSTLLNSAERLLWDSILIWTIQSRN